VTQKTLTNQKGIIWAARPLHKRSRAHSWSETFTYRLAAKPPVLKWKGGHFTESERKRLDVSRKHCINTIKESTGILIDTPTSNGGTSDSGNTAWRYFSFEVFPVLQSLIPEKYREQYTYVHYYLSVFLRVISTTRKVNTVMFRDDCLHLYLFILNEFSWVHLSETLHDLLGHSWQLMEDNEGYGLGQLTEQGSEGM
jgi:hypothetical protein